MSQLQLNDTQPGTVLGDRTGSQPGRVPLEEKSEAEQPQDPSLNHYELYGMLVMDSKNDLY